MHRPGCTSCYRTSQVPSARTQRCMSFCTVRPLFKPPKGRIFSLCQWDPYHRAAGRDRSDQEPGRHPGSPRHRYPLYRPLWSVSKSGGPRSGDPSWCDQADADHRRPGKREADHRRDIFWQPWDLGVMGWSRCPIYRLFCGCGTVHRHLPGIEKTVHSIGHTAGICLSSVDWYKSIRKGLS